MFIAIVVEDAQLPSSHPALYHLVFVDTGGTCNTNCICVQISDMLLVYEKARNKD